MSEIKSKSNIYKEIASKKEFYRAEKKEGNVFDILFTKKALEYFSFMEMKNIYQILFYLIKQNTYKSIHKIKNNE